MSRERRRAWASAGALCLAIAALDQAAKALVEANLVPGERVEALGPVEITLAYNRGVAFGLAAGGGVLLIAITVIALGVVGYLFSRAPTKPGMWVAVGLLAGGAIGNLIDRVRAGRVTDYVDILSWPPFNLADVAINAGVAVLALTYLREARRQASREPGTSVRREGETCR